MGVFGGGIGVSEIGFEECGESSKKVSEVDDGICLCPRGDFVWPLGNERHAVTAFVDAGFATAQRAGATVVLFGHQPGGEWAGSVVTGEDEQGVLIQSGVLQGLIDLTDDVVELHHKITVIAVAAFAFEGLRWNPGAVGDR